MGKNHKTINYIYKKKFSLGEGFISSVLVQAALSFIPALFIKWKKEEKEKKEIVIRQL